MMKLQHWPEIDAEVFILEDDPRLRARLVTLLEKTGGFRVGAQNGTVSDGLSALSRLVTMPDICLIDLGMPDGSGLDVVRAIKAKSDAKVLIFTVFGDQNSVISALEAGADGFVLKDSRDSELIDALHATLQGGSPISAAAAAHLLRRLRTPVSATPEVSPIVPANYGLTPRELETLELLARGFPQREAASLMKVSPHTIGAHVKAIYSKMAVNSRSEAVFEAVQSGLIDLGGPMR
ncbi:MAG: response regulator transcription factor [Hyphomonadaceae bacterium]|nr:response regulator transcription factor [Hyphomonadaceae bacterium]